MVWGFIAFGSARLMLVTCRPNTGSSQQKFLALLAGVDLLRNFEIELLERVTLLSHATDYAAGNRSDADGKLPRDTLQSRGIKTRGTSVAWL